MLLLRLPSLTLTEQIPNQNKNSHSWVWFSWKSTCFGVITTREWDKRFKLHWLDDEACVCMPVCVCVRVFVATTARIWCQCIWNAAGREKRPLPENASQTHIKKVIDANVRRRREGNQVNQLIRCFSPTVKPCRGFTASSEGNISMSSASEDNSVSPFWWKHFKCSFTDVFFSFNSMIYFFLTTLWTTLIKTEVESSEKSLIFKKRITINYVAREIAFNFCHPFTVYLNFRRSILCGPESSIGTLLPHCLVQYFWLVQFWPGATVWGLHVLPMSR